MSDLSRQHLEPITRIIEELSKISEALWFLDADRQSASVDAAILILENVEAI